MPIDGIRKAFTRAGRSSASTDVNDELAFHIARRVDELVARGMSPDDARDEATRAFGNVDTVRSELERLTRARNGRARRGEWVNDFAYDLRYAARGMRRTWAFTLVALLTLALGIGATTATFSIVNAVLLRPLAYPTPDRLVRVWERSERSQRMQLATPNLLDLAERSRTVSHLAGYLGGATVVLGGDESVRAQAYGVTREFFGVFNVKPALGRLPVAEEALANGPRVAVVSHEFWERHLGSTREIESRSLDIYGRRYRVIGVMPPGFAYPASAEIWMAREFDAGESRTSHNWQAVGRLTPTASVDAARGELDGIMRSLATQYGSAMNGVGITILPLGESLTGNVRKPLSLIFGAVAFVLLVACVNLASANLARGESRRQEMAVRAALGAGRWRLGRQLLAENLLLSIVGGAFALVVGYAFTKALVMIAPSNLPRISEVRLDTKVAAFTIIVSTLTGVLIGVLPAMQVARTALRDAISAGGRAAIGGDGGGSRRILIGAEVALVVMLLVGAGLTLRSFRTLLARDPGFDASGVLTVRVDPPGSKYDDSTRSVALFERVLAEARALPSVQSVGAINIIPLSSWHINGGFDMDGGGEMGNASYRVIAGDYFRVMGIPLRRGRMFGEGDRSGAPHVVIVNETAAAKIWPGKDAIGQRIRYRGMDQHRDDWMTVVGVVGDVNQLGLDAPVEAETYVPMPQRPERMHDGASIVVRSTTDPAALTTAMRDRVRAIDADIPTTIATFESLVMSSVADRRFTMLVLTAFGSFALFLAAVGIYGVLAYSVNRRTREIGVRMALGAERQRVLGMILGDGMRSVVPGIAVGVVGALLLSRLIAGLLYGVAPSDPLTFVAVVAVLVVVTLAASLLPARRATKVDPMVAIRAQ
ncbi:MAG TPA: ABC transporter permease [Gemmatimonadaceae bacterium]|nr:ABC transporter permease [Gemmatimonadaceae bacterium]